ncbi:MAG: hypothetical protein WB994_01770 [Candidatus Acidiferrum sp.]
MSDSAETQGAKTELKTFGRTRPSPGRHTLDLSVVVDAPLKMNGQPSTFAEIYRKLRDSKIEKMPEFMRDAYGIDQGEIKLSGDWPLLSTMEKLIELTRQGIDPHRVMWFYYDNDWSRDADESYRFFAVFDPQGSPKSGHVGSAENRP